MGEGRSGQHQTRSGSHKRHWRGCADKGRVPATAKTLTDGGGGAEVRLHRPSPHTPDTFGSRTNPSPCCPPLRRSTALYGESLPRRPLCVSTPRPFSRDSLQALQAAARPALPANWHPSASKRQVSTPPGQGTKYNRQREQQQDPPQKAKDKDTPATGTALTPHARARRRLPLTVVVCLSPAS